MGCNCKNKGTKDPNKKIVRTSAPSPRTSGRKLIKREIK